MPGRILIIDDDEGFANGLARSLRHTGHDVTTCVSAAEARRTLTSGGGADVVVLDYHLPDADGLALLDELRASASGAVYLMATAFPEVDIAVEAMRRGAFDYVAKGADPRECLMRIERGVEVALLRRRVAEASSASSGPTVEQGLLGESTAMKKLRARLDALAASDDTTALVIGETGTGKGVIARAIHTKSRRAFEPFVALDCTTIPATLVESELFGHEKGSFSGATASKVGRVEAAGRGTLLLDEIGELEQPIQAKLLRLLEEREFTRVGSTRARRLEARIITATNRDLARAVEEGRFRADLRYRLEVFVVEVPPLRERGDDVFLLAAHFSRERARALDRPEPRLHPDVVTNLLRYRFPGNVRELRNMVEQASLLATSEELTLEEFPVLKRVASGWNAPLPNRPSHPPPAGGIDVGSSPFPPAAHDALRTGDVGASFGDHRVTAVHSLPGPTARGAAAGPRESSPNLADIRRTHAEGERVELVRALQETGGNVSAAAKRLGISRYQMLRRLAKYGLR